MSHCIDLKKEFGQRFVVQTEESYFAGHGTSKNYCCDPWLYELRGARGNICPWGCDLLAICLHPGQPKIAKRLMREAWVIQKASQTGDDGEVNAVFHVVDFEAAAEYARLYHRPQLSAVERERRAAQMRENRTTQVDSKFRPA